MVSQVIQSQMVKICSANVLDKTQQLYLEPLVFKPACCNYVEPLILTSSFSGLQQVFVNNYGVQLVHWESVWYMKM